MPHDQHNLNPHIVAGYAATTMHERAKPAEDGFYGHHEALGRAAVASMAKFTERAAAAHTEDDLDEVTAIARANHLYLEDAREELAAIPDEKRAKVARALKLSSMPKDLQAALAGDGAHSDESLLERLTATDNGQPVVSDALLQSVLAWHTHDLSEQQRRFDRHEAPQHKTRFQHLIAQAVLDGRLPYQAMNNTADRLLFSKLYLDDGMDTIARGRHGYVTMIDQHNHYTMVLSPETDNDTITHELTHIITGADEQKLPLLSLEDKQRYIDEHGALALKAHIGLYRLFGTSRMATLLNEAVTEHVMLMLEHNAEDTHPDSPGHEERAYIGAGYLLDTLCTAGQQPIEPAVFLEAFFANGDRTAPPLAELERQLHQAFPDHTFAAEFDALQPQDGKDFTDTLYDYIHALRSSRPMPAGK